MALANTETTYDVTFLLAGAAGKVDPNTPAALVLDPAVVTATSTPVIINADGTAATFTATNTAIGEVPYTLTFDKNLAAGVLNLVHTGVLQFVETVIDGADTVVVTERPAA